MILYLLNRVAQQDWVVNPEIHAATLTKREHQSFWMFIEYDILFLFLIFCFPLSLSKLPLIPVTNTEQN